MKLWLPIPTPFAHIQMWGCVRGNWQYAIGYNQQFDHWTASVKRWREPEGFIQLGFDHPTRDAAEAAVDKHYKGTLQ